MPLLEQLEATRQQTLPLFDLPEEDLVRSYAPGKWNVRQLLNHLADAETVLYERVRRVIAEPKPVVWAFDQDRWSQHLDYATFPLAVNKSIYASVREGVIHLAKYHYDTSASKTFVHSETGLRTLKDEFEKIAWHNAHHLEQIRQALAG
ncbi:DinB family protein [Telluribacter sp. SYSU D00476]|uniref:DinB family protein n=1 Tax=Telluribacter sp. SYSU D00476 TaxID=2811430 RepID=UPI001FF5DC7A|nr:DinB family protein [Telluribacter sp. SYSU D00476]